MTTCVAVSSREQPHPCSFEVRPLIVGGLLLLALFLLLFAPVVGVRPDEAIAQWLRDPLQDLTAGLTAGLAAVVGALCLPWWRVTRDTQALHMGLAMALYRVDTLGIIDVSQLTDGGITTMLAAFGPPGRLP